MASRRCGCASDSCSCVVTGGSGIEVTGTGSPTNPFVVESLVADETLTVQNDNTTVLAGVTILDFQGAGVTVTNSGVAGEVVVAVPGEDTPGLAVEDEGTELLAAIARLNFTGAGVTATHEGSGEIKVNVPGAPAAPVVPPMACGTVTVSVPVGQSRTSVAITFPVGRFSAIPKVTTSNGSMNTNPQFYTGHSGTSLSGVSIWATDRAGGAVTGSAKAVSVDWIAIQQT